MPVCMRWGRQLAKEKPVETPGYAKKGAGDLGTLLKGKQLEDPTLTEDREPKLFLANLDKIGFRV